MLALLAQLGCIMLADVSPGVSVPLAKAQEPAVAVDVRLAPITPQNIGPGVYEDWEFPVVAGAGFRTKFNGDLSSFSLGPQACVGAVRANAQYLPVLCGGLSLAQLEWVNQDFGVGIGSPYLEPAVGVRVGQGRGSVILSMPIEYMVRFGQPNVAFVGLRLGWGPWGWMHSSDPERVMNDCLGRCAGF